MDIREELKSAGVYPTGPVSAWPEERQKLLMDYFSFRRGGGAASKETLEEFDARRGGKKVKATKKQMLTGLMKTAGQAVRHGKVSAEIREERYDTCKSCPAFLEDSKRCNECGCFMEAKTWVGGNPDMLCPLKKWER